MPEPVTASSLLADIKQTGHGLANAVNEAREAAIAYLAAKRDYERAWNRAYLEAKGSIPDKKAKADIATEELQAVLDDALERKRFTKLDADHWESLVRGYEEVGRLARQELRSLS